MSRVIAAALVLCAFLAAPAFAADNGFYVGAGIGQGYVKVDDVALDNFKGDDTGFKVIAGFRPFKMFALEANYVDLGSAKDNVAGVNVNADTTGIDAFAVGVLPIPVVDIFAKVGVISWDQDIHFSSIASSSDSGTDMAYGLGVGVAFGSAAVRAEYERFEIPHTDSVDMISVSFTWTFL
jgi:outer membrane protein with beta-barrel domain